MVKNLSRAQDIQGAAKSIKLVKYTTHDTIGLDYLRKSDAY